MSVGILAQKLVVFTALGCECTFAMDSAKAKQVWIGNVPSDLSEEQVMDTVRRCLPPDMFPPFKVFMRPGRGESVGQNYGFLHWVNPLHAEWFRNNAVIIWPNGKYALIRSFACTF